MKGARDQRRHLCQWPECAGENIAQWPHGMFMALEAIGKSKPASTPDIRLTELLRGWNSR